MGFLNRLPHSSTTSEKSTPKTTGATNTPANHSVASLPHDNNAANAYEKRSSDTVEEGSVSWFAIFMGSVASIGGFMFGYESGQISGSSS